MSVPLAAGVTGRRADRGVLPADCYAIRYSRADPGLAAAAVAAVWVLDLGATVALAAGTAAGAAAAVGVYRRYRPGA